MTFNRSIVNGKSVFTGYKDYNRDDNYSMLFTITEHIITFYKTKFEAFITSGYTSSNVVDEMFSFSIINEWQYYPLIRVFGCKFRFLFL